MARSIDPLALRAVMGRAEWLVPEPFGPAGWRMLDHDRTCSVIVTDGPAPLDLDGGQWRHASMTRPGAVPSYEDLCRLKRAVWGDEGEAYAVFARSSRHVSIHNTALHLWGRPDGKPVLPDFGALGRI